MAHPCRYPGLDPRIQSRTLSVKDLQMHLLVAGTDLSASPGQPLVLLLHGFPEFSYSWRKVIVPIANAGYHVVAPDLRGYAQTSPVPIPYETDLQPFSMANLVDDVVALVAALGYTEVAAVVGHDFGSALAGLCALVRPDLFKSVVVMSAPFTAKPFAGMDAIGVALASLDPPRKHYVHYFSTPDANADMMTSGGGLKQFLREYYHMKSADWPGNDPHPLLVGSIDSFAKLPHYYVMPIGASMAEVTAGKLSQNKGVNPQEWLSEDEYEVYIGEYGRTGFQGGLNWYRALVLPPPPGAAEALAGKVVEVPSMYLSGRQDWGVYQAPGSVDGMRERMPQMKDEDFVLIDGAGHWVQQERHEEVIQHLLRFLKML